MRYGIDPVEKERAVGDDHEELQLNDSVLSQRTLTPAASPGRGVEAEEILELQACTLTDLSHANQVETEHQASTLTDLSHANQDRIWLPLEEVGSGRTARERAQDVLERHRHWSTGGEGIPRHWRFDTWDPKQEEKATTDGKKQNGTR